MTPPCTTRQRSRDRPSDVCDGAMVQWYDDGVCWRPMTILSGYLNIPIYHRSGWMPVNVSVLTTYGINMPNKRCAGTDGAHIVEFNYNSMLCAHAQAHNSAQHTDTAWDRIVARRLQLTIIHRLPQRRRRQRERDEVHTAPRCVCALYALRRCQSMFTLSYKSITWPNTKCGVVCRCVCVVMMHHLVTTIIINSICNMQHGSVACVCGGFGSTSSESITYIILAGVFGVCWMELISMVIHTINGKCVNRRTFCVEIDK